MTTEDLMNEILALRASLTALSAERDEWKQLKAEADAYLEEVRQSHFTWQQRAQAAEAKLEETT